jgi:UDP-glucose:(heptosyl)LPS alpha-1,3-glucosyltransferase
MAFLFVGAGIRRKGLLELLEAFARLPSGRVRLVVLGRQDKKEAARMRRAIAGLGLADRVRVEGFASDLRPYYAAADAFVLPTKFDPFSNATAEALACGLPVITTSANGVSELMTDGLDGMVLADPYNLTELAEAVARLQDADRRRMGEAGRALAERLTWKRHADAMLAVYEAVRRGRP